MSAAVSANTTSPIGTDGLARAPITPANAPAVNTTPRRIAELPTTLPHHRLREPNRTLRLASIDKRASYTCEEGLRPRLQPPAQAA